MNEEQEVDTSADTQFRMIDVVAAELQALQEDSMKFREELTNAKTSVKRNYFRKKLTKNNKKMMNMLVAFDKLRGREVSTATDDEVIPEPERPEVPELPDE